MTGKQRYRALTGMHYPADPELDRELRKGEPLSEEQAAQLKRVEAGAIVDDLPEASIKSLLRMKAIEKYKEPRKKGPSRKPQGERGEK